jgi:hypothetical protein
MVKVEALRSFRAALTVARVLGFFRASGRVWQSEWTQGSTSTSTLQSGGGKAFTAMSVLQIFHVATVAA